MYSLEILFDTAKLAAFQVCKIQAVVAAMGIVVGGGRKQGAILN